MTDIQEVHKARLRTALEKITEFEGGPPDPNNPELARWQKKAVSSLGGLLGEGNRHEYEMERLSFCVPGLRFGHGDFDSRDREQFFDDLKRARGIIEDALDDAEVGLLHTPPAAPHGPRVAAPAPIVLNNYVTTVMSNVLSVSVEQLLKDSAITSLKEPQQQEAQAAAEELAREIKGEKRWEVVSKWAGRLWNLGEPVFKTVGVPLLLEYLKRISGK